MSCFVQRGVDPFRNLDLKLFLFFFSFSKYEKHHNQPSVRLFDFLGH